MEVTAAVRLEPLRGLRPLDKAGVQKSGMKVSVVLPSRLTV